MISWVAKAERLRPTPRPSAGAGAASQAKPVHLPAPAGPADTRPWRPSTSRSQESGACAPRAWRRPPAGPCRRRTARALGCASKLPVMRGLQSRDIPRRQRWAVRSCVLRRLSAWGGRAASQVGAPGDGSHGRRVARADECELSKVPDGSPRRLCHVLSNAHVPVAQLDRAAVS